MAVNVLSKNIESFTAISITDILQTYPQNYYVLYFCPLEKNLKEINSKQYKKKCFNFTFNKDKFFTPYFDIRNSNVTTKKISMT